MPRDVSQAVWFTGPCSTQLRTAPVRDPIAGEILVRATRSLISAGTEMIVYRGDTTPGDRMPPTSEGTFPFPVKYGYQVVGEVIAAGAQSGYRAGDRVFARHPHQDLFTIEARPEYVARVPRDVDDVSATFLNLIRVALTAVLDVPVKVGETAVVLGQGIVGTMCARIAGLNAGQLLVADRFEKRRDLARRYGVSVAVAPEEVTDTVLELTGGRGADVVYEASGAPAALQTAIDIAADRGEIVAVSMYGKQEVPLRLVPEFHFRRLRITSSQMTDQVRWDWARRTAASFDLLQRFGTDGLVTTTVPFSDAAKAYDLLDRDPASVLGVVLDYGQ